MNKSYNDISAQVERCIALANQLGGRWTANCKHRADRQYFAQIGARARVQHGIPVFCQDRDTKYPLIVKTFDSHDSHDSFDSVDASDSFDSRDSHDSTPTEAAHERVRLEDWLNADNANRKRLQDTCRHLFIKKMYAELLTDMEICKMEGWDILEYPRMIRDAVAVCFPKPRQLTLF